MLVNVKCNGFYNEICPNTHFGKWKGNEFVMNTDLLVYVSCNGYCNELGNRVFIICNGSCNEFSYVTGFSNWQRNGIVMHSVLLCNLVIAMKYVNQFNGNFNVNVLNYEI